MDSYSSIGRHHYYTCSIVIMCNYILLHNPERRAQERTVPSAILNFPLRRDPLKKKGKGHKNASNAETGCRITPFLTLTVLYCPNSAQWIGQPPPPPVADFTSQSCTLYRGRSNSRQRKVATLGKHHLSSALFGLNFKLWLRNTQLQVIVHGAVLAPPPPRLDPVSRCTKTPCNCCLLNSGLLCIFNTNIIYIFLIRTLFTYF
jgi:hypothetical protein